MSASKLSFFNRAHIQRKVDSKDSTELNEMASRLRILLEVRFPSRFVRFMWTKAKVEYKTDDLDVLSTLLDVEYIGRVIAALKVCHQLSSATGIGTDQSGPEQERIFTINDVPNYGAYFFIAPDLNSATAAASFRMMDPEIYGKIFSPFETVDQDYWSIVHFHRTCFINYDFYTPRYAQFGIWYTWSSEYSSCAE